MESAIVLSFDERVATLTLNRPPLNILDLAALADLGRAADELESRSEELQAVVVRGAGPRAFSAGVAVEDHTPDKAPLMLERFHGALETLRKLPLPTVAAVHGHCLGGGMEVAGACDIVVAEEGARFGQPEIELGCFPPYAAALFARKLGHGVTLELLASGRILEAVEAERLGFVTFLAPAGELETRLDEILRRLTSKSAVVTRLVTRAVKESSELPFEEALARSERLYLEDLCRTEDMHEGLAAFLEKRRPHWKHR